MSQTLSTPLLQKLAREHAAVAGVLPPGVVSAERRDAALAELLARGLPSGREENWRYANLRLLERSAFAPAPAAGGAVEAAIPGEALTLPAPIAGFTRYLVIDGTLRTAAASAAGVTVSSLRAGDHGAEGWMRTEAPGPDPGSAEQRFALLNEAFALDSIMVATEGSAAAQPAIELLWVASGRGAAYPRLQVELAPGTRLRLLERYVGGAPEVLSNGLVRVRLGRTATLEHYRLQAHSDGSIWIDTLEATVGEQAHYGLNQYGVGARSARSTVGVRLAGPEASVTLHCASIAESTQANDVYARIDHAAPRTRTVQNFRGIASGRSRVAFNGHIVVRQGAHGADSRQSLRSLLAGPEAEVDARPQLEIYTDEVKCSHGATAGKLDETMLFYLLSRGIGRDTALSLLKWAFLEDTVMHIGDAALRAQIEQLLAAHLKDATIAEGRRS